MHPQDPQNPEHGRSTHDKKEDEMDSFNSYLWKYREVLGELSDAKVYNFPYKNLYDLKNLPDKVLVHMHENPGGILIVIQVPSKKFYYITADEYGA